MGESPSEAVAPRQQPSMAQGVPPEDIAGVPLAAAFSAEIVEPLLTQHFPELCATPLLSPTPCIFAGWLTASAGPPGWCGCCSLPAHFCCPGWCCRRYASALIGPGSEILGFDDTTSRDHDWGPRLMLFLEAADRDAHGAAVTDLLRTALPTTFKGCTHTSNPPLLAIP